MQRSIALFDYKVIPTNPVGGRHLIMLQGLYQEYDFTVFSVEFENPCPERIRWVKIPVPTRPLALLFIAYHLIAPIYYMLFRLRQRQRFDLIQFVESNFSFGNILRAGFCHRAYLKHHWAQSGSHGLRGWVRWLDHWLHALLEPWAYNKARHIVVPSQGLAREILREYPRIKAQTHIFPNPVNFQRMQAPADFDRAARRAELGFSPDDQVIVFVALGQFERKGLPLLLTALQQLKQPQVKLLVVGGESDLVQSYQRYVERMGLQHAVVFVGMQRNTGIYFQLADAFILPSTYETFANVVFDAAAAQTLIISTLVSGVEDFLCDGKNGIAITATVEGILQGLRRFLSLGPEERQALTAAAYQRVQQYNTSRYVDLWRQLYASELK